MPYFCSMRYYWDLIWHFLRSNSRHGTHSPFVYRLADEVVYAKRDPVDIKEVEMPISFEYRYGELLVSLLSFMGVGLLKTVGEDVERGCAVWVDLRVSTVAEAHAALLRGAVLVVHEPYLAKGAWKELSADPAVIVSIDLFHFGIMIGREGQRKEAFRLRYPYRR